MPCALENVRATITRGSLTARGDLGAVRGVGDVVVVGLVDQDDRVGRGRQHLVDEGVDRVAGLAAWPWGCSGCSGTPGPRPCAASAMAPRSSRRLRVEGDRAHRACRSARRSPRTPRSSAAPVTSGRVGEVNTCTADAQDLGGAAADHDVLGLDAELRRRSPCGGRPRRPGRVAPAGPPCPRAVRTASSTASPGPSGFSLLCRSSGRGGARGEPRARPARPTRGGGRAQQRGPAPGPGSSRTRGA